MIRSTNHSSFPRVDDSPLDQLVRLAWRRRQRGAVSEAELRQAEDEVITVTVAQQSRAFIDIVTDGMVRWEGPLSHVGRHLDGAELGGLVRWFDTNFHDRVVRVTGELRHRGTFLTGDYEVAASVALGKTVKMILPGPVTFARLCDDRHYGNLARLVEAAAEALAAEVEALAASGVRCFQLDEPMLCRHPEDLDLVGRSARRVFDAAGADAETVLSTYYGDLEAIGDHLDRLPGTHLGLEMIAGSPNWGLLDRLPAGRGVVLGLFDARTTRQEDAADVAALLEPHRERLLVRDVVVGPNAGLELLPRDQAFDKLLHARYLVEKLSQEWPWDS